MNTYFNASIRQHVQRGEHLLGCIPKPTQLPLELHPLIQTTTYQISTMLRELEALLNEPKMQLPEYQPERLRRFRRAVQQMSLVENTCIAALTRRNEDDGFLTGLVAEMCKEISYPLLSPIVTSLSQQYFYIYSNFNLLFVPLGEGAFLLHLPDLYHELAHPLITTQYNQHLKGFQASLIEALTLVFAYIAEERSKEQRGRGPQQFIQYLAIWEESWLDWMIEFFCDLFAIYTLGPAFAWSHLHLCAKDNEPPFRVPLKTASTHPANHARMRAMIYGLELSDFTGEAVQIEQAWNALISLTNTTVDPEYQRCFPDDLLARIAQKAYEGVHASGFGLVTPEALPPVCQVLNRAWDIFWQSPERYVAWERQAILQLRELITRRVAPAVLPQVSLPIR